MPPTVVPATITGYGAGPTALMRSLTTGTSKEKPATSNATGSATGTTAAKKTPR